MSDEETKDLQKCDLHGAFSYFVQVLLIVLIFVAVKSRHSSPVKHHFEKPKRSLPLFFLDGFKQLLSNGLIHVINLVVSSLLGSLNDGDECGLYYSAVVIDVTLGTSICFGLLYSFDKGVSYQYSKVSFPHQKLKSGNYFKKVEDGKGSKKYAIDYFCWFQQTVIWCIIVFLVAAGLHKMKVIVTALQFLFGKLIAAWGNFSMKM